MGVINLSNIKTQIKTILDASNLTAATYPLFTNLSKSPIKTISTLNPSKIATTAEKYPFITSYIESKTTEPRDISRGSANAIRRADIDIKIVTGLWNDTYLTKDSDPADEDLGKLVENIEYVLRQNATLNGSVHWSYPTKVDLYEDMLSEQAHCRFGIINLKAIVFY